jgi:hypothetical protein
MSLSLLVVVLLPARDSQHLAHKASLAPGAGHFSAGAAGAACFSIVGSGGRARPL